MATRKKAARKFTRAGNRSERTRTRFLQAAAQVFVLHGYEGTSIRAIAARARVNLGSLQHYWGSKRLLFRNLFESRFVPMQDEHLRRLRQIEARCASGARPRPGEVLQPLLDLTFAADFIAGSARARALRRKLYGRALLDPSPVVVTEMNRIFADSVTLFVALMRRACPDVPAAELDWRLNCITGAHLFSLVHTERMGRFFGEEVQVDDELAGAWVLQFFLHGIAARPTRN